MRRSTALKTIIDAQCEALAPGDAIDLRDLVLKKNDDDWGKWTNQRFDEIMRSVALEHALGETIMERRSILAIAAGSLPYGAVLKYIPNLTHYQYRQAKLYSLRMTRDRKIESSKRIKFDKKKLEDFVIFFTRCVLTCLNNSMFKFFSELFRTDLPFGRRNLKKLDGTAFDVPDVLRTMKHTEVFFFQIVF
jgi:hypothetical protein